MYHSENPVQSLTLCWGQMVLDMAWKAHRKKDLCISWTNDSLQKLWFIHYLRQLILKQAATERYSTSRWRTASGVESGTHSNILLILDWMASSCNRSENIFFFLVFFPKRICPQGQLFSNQLRVDPLQQIILQWDEQQINLIK